MPSPSHPKRKRPVDPNLPPAHTAIPTGAPIPSAPKPVLIQPPAMLLQGASGGGKTHSLATLPAAGIETFVLITEPGGAESLLDGMRYYKAPIEKLHWATALPATSGWDAMD